MIWLLTILATGEPPINVGITHTQAYCQTLGDALVDIVKKTKPDRSAKLSVQCDTVLDYTVSEPPQ